MNVLFDKLSNLTIYDVGNMLMCLLVVLAFLIFLTSPVMSGTASGNVAAETVGNIVMFLLGVLAFLILLTAPVMADTVSGNVAEETENVTVDNTEDSDVDETVEGDGQDLYMDKMSSDSVGLDSECLKELKLINRQLFMVVILTGFCAGFALAKLVMEWFTR